MRIRTQLTAVLSLAFLFVIALWVASWAVNDNLDRISTSQIQSQLIAREVSALLLLTNEYALHAEERQAQQWRTRHQRILGLFGATADKTAAMPSDALAQAQLLSRFFDQLIAAKTVAENELQRRRTQLLLDQVLTKTQELFDTVNRASDGAFLQREKLEDQFHILVNAIPLFFLLLLLVIAALLFRRVLQPLSRLHQAVLAVANGDISVRSATTSTDEIGVVSRTFDALAVDLVTKLQQEVTERKQAEDDLQQQKEYLQTIFETEPECVKIVAPNGKLQNMNPAGLRMLEVDSLEEAQEIGLLDFVDPAYRNAFIELHKSVCAGNSGMLEFPIRGKKGTLRWLETHATPLRDGKNQSISLLGVTRDVTQHKAFRQELERQAHVDYLTGVNNRGHFVELAEVELARAIRYESEMSIFMLDVDFFKRINDSHGHQVGDRLLKTLAEVCRQTLREIDIVGRVGGEEFAVVLPETRITVAMEVAERLRAAIANTKVPMESGLPIQFSVSIGVASLISKDDNLDVLFSQADKALYEAKNTGRNKVCSAFDQKELRRDSHKHIGSAS